MLRSGDDGVADVRRWRWWMVGAVACGEPGAITVGIGSDDGVEPEPSFVPGDPSVLVGAFQIDVVPADDGAGYTSVTGRVYDGPTPSALVWELADADEGCELLTPRVPFCLDPCGGGAVCVEDGVCEPYPKAQDLGGVRVDGALTTDGADSVALTMVSNTWLLPGAVDIAWPAFDEGAVVTVVADGSEAVSAFNLSSWGVPPLELLDGDRTLVRGGGLALRWTAGGDPAHERVRIKLDISHHGGTKGMIVCLVDDDGGFDLPAPMVDGLLDLGVSGFPTVITTRQSTGSVTLEAGRVDLTVSTTVETPLEIPGVISCTDDAQCPEGQRCLSDLRCG